MALPLQRRSRPALSSDATSCMGTRRQYGGRVTAHRAVLLAPAAFVAAATLLLSGCASSAAAGDRTACESYFAEATKLSDLRVEIKAVLDAGEELDKVTALRHIELATATDAAAEAAYATADSDEVRQAFNDVRKFTELETEFSDLFALSLSKQMAADACRDAGVAVEYRTSD